MKNFSVACGFAFLTSLPVSFARADTPYSTYECRAGNGDVYTVETHYPTGTVGFLTSDITFDGRAGRRAIATGVCASASSPKKCKGLTLDFYVVPAGQICDQDRDVHVGTMDQCDLSTATRNAKDLSTLRLLRPQTAKLGCTRVR